MRPNRRKMHFLGLDWQVVDFVDKNQQPSLDHDESFNKTIAIFTILSYIILAIDIVNIVLDAIFTKKLFDMNSEDFFETAPPNATDEEWFDSQEGQIMLTATVSTFLTTMVFGPILLRIIEGYDPNRFDLTEVDMVTALHSAYYAHWSFIEVSAFLLEDATTIFLFFIIKDRFETSDFFAIANILTSLLSGLLSSLVVLFATVRLFSGIKRTAVCNEPCQVYFNAVLAIVPILVTLYMIFLAGFCVIGNACEAPAQDESASLAYEISSYAEIVYLASWFVGGLMQFFVLVDIIGFLCCRDNCIVWPTPDGLCLEGNLPLAP